MAKASKQQETNKEVSQKILEGIGAKFKEAREGMNITLGTLAARTKLSTVLLSEMEKGRLQNTTIETLLKINTELGLDLDDQLKQVASNLEIK